MSDQNPYQSPQDSNVDRWSLPEEVGEFSDSRLPTLGGCLWGLVKVGFVVAVFVIVFGRRILPWFIQG